jgi:nitrous oxide reductase accessory protein NosL
MKLISTILFFLATALASGLHGTAAFAQDDIAAHRSCVHCGMDRKAYGYSRVLVQYSDGMEVGVCSLHCAVVVLDSSPGRKTKAILVADRDSRLLINAEQAVWVMGGTKRGVMTPRPKWAFSTRTAADAFIREYGGTIITWNEALTAAREDLAREIR